MTFTFKLSRRLARLKPAHPDTRDSAFPQVLIFPNSRSLPVNQSFSITAVALVTWRGGVWRSRRTQPG